jgi:hypothetical protein
MPNLDPTQIRVAATGAFWKAPYGTTAPTDSTTAYSAAWSHLGYATNGFTVTQNLKTQPITAWQTTEPVLLINQSLDRKINVESLESDKQNLSLAWGNGSVAQTGVSAGGAVTFTSGTITTATAHGLVPGNWAFFQTITGTPGVVANTNYYVLTVPTATTMTVSATANGTPITITTGSSTGVVNAAPFSVTIPDSAIGVEFALGVDWSHGSYTNRLIFPRVQLLSLPAIKFVRDDAVRYPLEIQVLKPVDGSQSALVYGSDWAASS